MRRRIVACAIAAGVLAGAAGAAVQADDPAPARSTARQADPASVPVAPPRRRDRLPDGRLDPSKVHYRVFRPHLVARQPDPGGGPDWALKVFDADRYSLQRPARTLRGALRVGRTRCVQLGRVQGGAFGWVYGDGRFRRTAGIEQRVLQCTSRRRPEASVEFEATLKVVDPAAPELSTTAVWGLAPGASRVEVRGTGAADGAATTARGAFLRVAGPDARPGPRSGVAIGSRTLRIAPAFRDPMVSGRYRFPTPIPGTERVEARAPDPSGGPGYGLVVAESREGPPCVGGEGRVVGDRVGMVDLGFGLFEGGRHAPSCNRPIETAATRERPCDITTSSGNAEELEGDDVFLRRARIERRLQVGRTVIAASCHADVERVTLQTPRDIRTLVPSPLGRAILAVYDGTFPAGELVLTAHLKGGGTRTERWGLGF